MESDLPHASEVSFVDAEGSQFPGNQNSISPGLFSTFLPGGFYYPMVLQLNPLSFMLPAPFPTHVAEKLFSWGIRKSGMKF
ncbi:hypothetical protein HK096_005046 [Nowakowskiella sp. JEL0078]|nr:hypothetical protein HK096_005046 [Nowakowskiella sp. JEL0078]